MQFLRVVFQPLGGQHWLPSPVLSPLIMTSLQLSQQTLMAEQSDRSPRSEDWSRVSRLRRPGIYRDRPLRIIGYFMFIIGFTQLGLAYGFTLDLQLILDSSLMR